MQNYCRLKKSVSCIPKRNVKFQHVCALPERSLLTFVLAGWLSAKTLLSAAAFRLLVQQSERSTDSVSACIYAIQSKPQAAIMESFHSQNALFFQCIQCQRALPPLYLAEPVLFICRANSNFQFLLQSEELMEQQRREQGLERGGEGRRETEGQEAAGV